MSRVVIITHDIIAERMSGPAIRSWTMAKVLSNEHSVVLGSTQPPQTFSGNFKTCQVTGDSVRDLCCWAEIIVIQPTILYSFPVIGEFHNPLVVDLYNTFMIEGLEANKNLKPEEKSVSFDINIDIALHLLQRGDYFICSNERQKDFWLGMLCCIKKMNPDLYDTDPTGLTLLGIVPNGISSKPPVHTQQVVKGIFQSVQPSDKLLLWGGSACNWFDPVTLVEAVAILKRHRNDVKAFFMGSQVPGADVPDYIWSEYAKALHRSSELGLTGTDILFNPDWIPYNERENFLLEADLGISLHFNNLETRYSFRSRILDYLWAGIPVITNPGDYMGDLIQKQNLGRVVPARNPEKVAAAVQELLSDKGSYMQCRQNISKVRAGFTWEIAMEPLLSFCRKPWKQKNLNPGRFE